MTELVPDLKFEWTTEMEIFVVCEFAEYQNPAQILLNILEFYEDAVIEDIEKFGEKAVRKRLIRRIYELNPKISKFPQKYQDAFDTHRQTYLNDLKSSYLANSRNRLRELDRIYMRMATLAIAEENINNLRLATQTLREIISDAREEMSESNIRIEAETKEGAARISIESKVVELSDTTIAELMSQHERGERISLPASPPTGPEHALRDSGSSPESASGSNGPTRTESNPPTE